MALAGGGCNNPFQPFIPIIMALPLQLGNPFTPAEEATIDAAMQSIITIMQSKTGFNLSNPERNKLSKVGTDREPYVVRSISDYGPQYPNLNGQAYPLPLATDDLSTYAYAGKMLTGIAQMKELTEELRMVAGHFAYLFMRDQYQNAERYRSHNVAGAQVVYDGLKGCFEGQGKAQNP